MRVIVFASLIVLLTISCSNKKSNFSIEVRVTDNHGEMLYLAQRSLTGTFPVDSALPDKSGEYKLKGYASQPDFYILYIKPRNFINLIIHPGDKFTVLTKSASFDRDYLVEGSKDSRLIQKMVNMQTRTLEKITQISDRYEESIGKPDFNKVKKESDSLYNQVFNAHKEFSISLIRENPESLVGLMALYQQLGRNAPVFDYKKDFSFYEMVDSSLSRVYPNSDAVRDLNRKVAELRELHKFEIGSRAPEIALPDSTGKTITLSSLRGRNTVVVFWASWSTPSVVEMQKFEALASKNPGLNFYMVSLDRTKSSWLKSASVNKRAIHVSDLLYWDSPIVELYHIEKLPVTYLIDSNGFIAAKDFSADTLPGLIESIR